MSFPQLVLLPLLMVFAWGYLALRPSTRRRRAMLVFDVLVITLAVFLSAASAWWIGSLNYSSMHSIWITVMSTISIFHVFPAVLLGGWYIRRRVFVDHGE